MITYATVALVVYAVTVIGAATFAAIVAGAPARREPRRARRP